MSLPIGGYFINVYWWLFRCKLLVFILLVVIDAYFKKILFSHLFWLDSHLFCRSDFKQNKFECVFYQLNYFCGQVLELCLDWP
jgi:hypothetical protein